MMVSLLYRNLYVVPFLIFGINANISGVLFGESFPVSIGSKVVLGNYSWKEKGINLFIMLLNQKPIIVIASKIRSDHKVFNELENFEPRIFGMLSDLI